MGTKHDLKEYYFAKEVVRDFPSIKIELDNTLKVLYDHQQYLCVQHVINAIEESREMLTRQYTHYRMVLDKKGEM